MEEFVTWTTLGTYAGAAMLIVPSSFPELRV